MKALKKRSKDGKHCAKIILKNTFQIAVPLSAKAPKGQRKTIESLNSREIEDNNKINNSDYLEIDDRAQYIVGSQNRSPAPWDDPENISSKHVTYVSCKKAKAMRRVTRFRNGTGKYGTVTVNEENLSKIKSELRWVQLINFELQKAR